MASSAGASVANRARQALAAVLADRGQLEAAGEWLGVVLSQRMPEGVLPARLMEHVDRPVTVEVCATRPGTRSLAAGFHCGWSNTARNR